MSDSHRSLQNVPSATYRLQFNRDFNFRSALEITGYLSELGISDCYASPLLPAGPESTHGYDICSFGRLNPVLGTMGDFDRFVERLHQLQMGLLLDMVPNHMGTDPSNDWWVDVLEKGTESKYAEWFDIEWEPVERELHHKVLLPVLEDSYARVLEAGKLRVVLEDGRFALRYHDRKFPLSSASCARIIEELTRSCAQSRQVAAVAEDLKRLLVAIRSPQEARFSTDRDSPNVSERLSALLETTPRLRAESDSVFRRINGTPRQANSFDELHSLVREQHYRLADWKVGPDEINYRRFFDVTELVSLRMELPEVFQATHEFVFDLLHQGKINGLRIDHPDGLWDPKQYFQRLQAGHPSETGAAGKASALRAKEKSDPVSPTYVVVEKILTRDEQLQDDWPVDGTTGYDFLNQVNGLFVDGRNREAFDRLYESFLGRPCDFKSIVESSKKQVLSTLFRSELTALTQRLKTMAGSSRYGQDFTFRELRSVLTEVIAAFPVYRTYFTQSSEAVPPGQELYIRQAVARARVAGHALDPAVFDFLESLLLLHPPADLGRNQRNAWRQFVLRFQQLTGPVMAKGLEDTAFYNFNRLISLNEVGGDPDRFGIGPDDFHAFNAVKASHWPHSLLATATHDTKRGEDARARINVLSEMPDDWRRALERWQLLNQKNKSPVNGEPAPQPNDEYFLYQTLVGAWDDETRSPHRLESFRNRISAYMLKATREAKSLTSWLNPNTSYERATAQFIEKLLTHSANNQFLADFVPFQHKVSFFGMLNSLSQTLLKMTSPGVPDFYQGAELWDFNLVDPDNRRPVDYRLRQELLGDLRKSFERRPTDMPGLLGRLLGNSDSGQIKLYLIWRTLQFRRQQRELFERGSYVPISATGPKANHVCAFARVFGKTATIVIVPRLVLGLTQGVENLPLGDKVWLDTFMNVPVADLSPKFRNVLTGESHILSNGNSNLCLAKVLAQFPVALLENTA